MEEQTHGEVLGYNVIWERDQDALVRFDQIIYILYAYTFWLLIVF